MGKHRTTKDGMGIVYLFTNALYENEGIHKYGITINPFERRRIQSNSTPPCYPFFDKIVLFSRSYKAIENWLKEKFRGNGFQLEGEEGGTEWIRGDFETILSVYMDVLLNFPDTEMCYKGKRYKAVKGEIKEMKLPNCRFDLLGILDGVTVKCTLNDENFVVKDNKILVNGTLMSPSTYINKFHSRMTETNEHNGYQYFTYSGRLIYDVWQKLVRV